jgi:hypothetical protein
MNLLPFENIELKSPLNQEEIVEIINNNIAWNSELGLTFTKNTVKDYEGFSEHKTFKIRRILKSGINSFIPIATGIIHKKENGSQIKLKLRLHKAVMTLAIILTLFSGSVFISELSSSSYKKEEFKELINNEHLKESISQKQYKNITKQKKTYWSSLLFFIAPYLMCTIVFNYEAKIVKEKLKLILNAE